MKKKVFNNEFKKSLGIFLLLFLITTLSAQVPDKISYQAVVRDASHNLVKEQQIGVMIRILQGQADGNAVYTEIQNPQTNTNGLVSFEFGGGPGFENINWADGPFFLEVSIDISGGNNYGIIGTTQLLSVPYALHASTAGTLTQEFVGEEVDPVFQSSAAAEIIQNDIVNWNTAYLWGDHDSLYLYHDWVPDWTDITNRPEAISDFALDAGGNIISNLAAAIEPGDAVTKEYVDFLLARVEAIEDFLDMGAGFEVPTVSIDSILEIGANTITASGIVTDNGGSDLVFSRGFVWSTTENPDVDNYMGISNEGPQIGAFTSELSGLLPSTVYYIKAYASNVAGAGYSEQLSFTSPDSEEFVIDIDGNVYGTIEINGWLWMAENLKVTRYNDGSDIPKLSDNYLWSTTNSGAYSIYSHELIDGINSEEEVMEMQGGLYNYYAVVDERGLCPSGWRLPTDQEWKDLELFMGMDENEVHLQGWRGTDQGGRLKSVRTEPQPHPRWNAPNLLAQDLYGYNAIPSKYRGSDGVYGSPFGRGAGWWSSTANSSNSAWYRSVMFDKGKMSRFVAYKNYGFAIRCIQD